MYVCIYVRVCICTYVHYIITTVLMHSLLELVTRQVQAAEQTVPTVAVLVPAAHINK